MDIEDFVVNLTEPDLSEKQPDFSENNQTCQRNNQTCQRNRCIFVELGIYPWKLNLIGICSFWLGICKFHIG